MPQEIVYIGADEVKIETAPITLIFNSTAENSFYPERLMIDPVTSLDHFRGMSEISPYTAGFFKLVVSDYPKDVTLANIKAAQIGFQHLIGLFDLSLQLLLLQKPFGWKYPEAYLHPKYQAPIADALITFSQPDKFIRFITNIKQSLLKGAE